VTETTTVRRASATKLVASAGVLAAAVAVAGLGTLGGFTDSTAPVDASVETGVLSIDLSAPGDFTFDGSAFAPGESSGQLVDLVNDGDTALSSVTLTTWASESSVLDTDRVNGLQLALEACSEAWSGEGTAATCGGTLRTLYSGPAVLTNHGLASPASAAPGEVDHLRMVVSLPDGASGPEFQDVSSTLALSFTATQRDGEAR
jgi:hypothetical protein